MQGSNRSRSRRTALGALVVTASVATEALAHIDMVSPVPREQGRSREPNSNLKQGPCGQVTNGRTEKVSVFAPGETIDVTWRETTNHRSYYRVAFDEDGDDAFPVFSGTGIGAEGVDPAGPCPIDGRVILAYEMQDGSGGSHTLRVKLPDVECERCTLQVVQFMYDTTRPYYFQCADLALRRSTGPDAGAVGARTVDAGTDAGAATADAAASAAESPTAAAGCWSQIAPNERPTPPRGQEPAPLEPPASSAAPARAPDVPAAAEDASETTPRRSGGGCTLLASGERTSPLAPLLALTSAASVWWRRARRPRSRADRAQG